MASKKRAHPFEENDGASSTLRQSSHQKKRALLSSKVDALKLGTSTSSKRPSRPPSFCPHCGNYLSIKTFRKHKKLYYNGQTDVWNKAEDCLQSDEIADSEARGRVLQVPDSPVDTAEEIRLYTSDPPEVEMDQSTTSHDSSSESEEEEQEDEYWEDDGEQLDIDFPCEDEKVPGSPQQGATNSRSETTLLAWLLLFLLRLQAKHYLPDAAINSLLKFLYIFLSIVGQYSDFVAHMATNFPSSVFHMRKFFGLTEEFTRFVVCRKCYSVYTFDHCIESHGTTIVSKYCHYRTHPNCRSHCNTLLLQTVNLLGGRKKLCPFKVYCYGGLRLSLQKLLNRSDFTELCEHWRSRECNSSLSDIYDGKIWKEFQYINGQPYLAAPYVYALMLNVDWFQPYKHTQASVGAMYLTIMNLPYAKRFKRENIILLGIIPGPSEPARDINQYLRPLVKELMQYFTGVPMKIYGKKDTHIVRCLLIGVPCDMPAGRKACGFLSHSAILGCTRCFKEFPGSVGCKDYSGFNRNAWKLRTNTDHRKSVNEIQHAKTKTERDALESKHGCRYSVLLELPYFDPTRMLIIDPMHNLFLGTAKHIVKRVWSTNVLDLSVRQICEKIQATVDSIHVPSDIGRIPRKVETGFSGFTADQYKTWVTLYSIPCLYGVIDSDHLECWRHFVIACRLLCQRSLSATDVELADALLLQFCRRVQRMYGSDAITPNMHMHCHLKEVLLDYGPVYGFWLFSYERYNGILQHQPTSNRCIEIQVMRRFIYDNTAFALQPPTEFGDRLGDLCNLQPRVTGSLLLMTRESAEDHSTLVELPSSYSYHVLTGADSDSLKRLLAILHSFCPEEVQVNSMCRRYKLVTLNGVRFPSSTSKQVSVGLARLNTAIYGDALPVTPQESVTLDDASLRACKINQFIKVSYSVNDKISTHCFAVVSWYQQHPSRFQLGKPVQVWCKNLFEGGGMHSFLSLTHCGVTCICRCVYAYMKPFDTGEDVLVVVPIVS